MSPVVAQASMALAVGFRNDFVADDKQHGPGCKSQAPGQQHGGAADHDGADHRPQRLDQPCQCAQHYRKAPGIAGSQQRGCDDKTLGYILYGNAQRERAGTQSLVGGIAHADGQTFGQVVKGDGT